MNLEVLIDNLKYNNITKRELIKKL